MTWKLVKSPIFFTIRRSSGLPFVSHHPIIHSYGHWSQLIQLLVSWKSYPYKPFSTLYTTLPHCNIYIKFHLIQKALGYSPLEHTSPHSGLAQLGYFAIYPTHNFSTFIPPSKGPDFNSWLRHLLPHPLHPLSFKKVHHPTNLKFYNLTPPL